ncbi:MAG: hypothetical protein PHV68_07650 [Candidatus Gastranaerophilales bacterium]|nr:hypothetical protein [Candidatus Gastranaerophilales bacterium]
MSFPATLSSNNVKFKNFLGFAKAYLRKNNLFVVMQANLMKGIKDFLTANKKLKVAQYRVNHLRYRMHQMEKMIGDNNPSGIYTGKKMDLFR